MKLSRLLLFLMLCLLLAVSMQLHAQPYTVHQTVYNLPIPMAALSNRTVYVDQTHSIYLFGGFSESIRYHTNIVQVDLDAEQAVILSTRLPAIFSGRDHVAEYGGDGLVYIFRLQDVYTFDPVTETISLLGSNLLPESVGDYTNAEYVPSQNAIFLFGYRGSASGNFMLKYNVASGTVDQLSNVPAPSNNVGYTLSYADSSDSVYLLGGNWSNSYRTLIQRFDPSTESFTTLSATLPKGNAGCSGAYVLGDNAVYSIGGSNTSVNFHNIYRFDVGSETLVETTPLLDKRAHHGVVYVPYQQRIYVLGGTDTRSGGYAYSTNTIFYLQFNINIPPVAMCQDVTVRSTNGCQANVTSAQVDAGSSDPDGDPLTLSLSPSDPYLLGQTPVTLTVSDGQASSSCTATITVVDGAAPDITNVSTPLSPAAVNTAITTSASFTDDCDADDHTAIWDWGDNSTSPGTLDQTNNTVTGSHTYTSAGVYTVSLTVTDAAGNSDQAVASEFVVIYDPDAGFVTGGGWIDSPAGAYINNPTLTGKASFGFVSKYKKGQTTPTGQTQFQFKTGNLNFHSDSYDWLVITNHKAMYKGDGTINNAGNYGFQLSAIDAALTPSTDDDLFRIRIWNKDNNDALVYDNQVNEDDPTADPTTALGGGNIQIQSKGGGNSSATMEEPAVTELNIPENYSLEQNYPNPFNPTTTITFGLPEAGDVKLAIYNLNGQLIRLLHSGSLSAGRHSLVWDATNSEGARVASGIYLYRLEAGEFVATKRLLFMK